MGVSPHFARALKVYLAAGVMTTTVATPILAYTTWQKYPTKKNTPQRITEAFAAMAFGVGYGIIWPITCGVVVHDAYKGKLNI